MSRQWKEVKTQTVSPEEIERMLFSDFGDKVQPVDADKLAKQQRQRVRYGNK